MRTITRIYRAGVPRVSVVELDCGHKTTHETAAIKQWQWFIGRTGMVCPTCNNASGKSPLIPIMELNRQYGAPASSAAAKPVHNYPEVTITATDDSVVVTVVTAPGPENIETFDYSFPGIITGADLQSILAACGIHADYDYREAT